jgi:hypothetical protein
MGIDIYAKWRGQTDEATRDARHDDLLYQPQVESPYRIQRIYEVVVIFVRC